MVQDNRHILNWAISKWPLNREPVLFDKRSDQQKAAHKTGAPKDTFTTENLLWGGGKTRPQLVAHSEVLMSGFVSSVHHLKK